ncbi:MAG: recombination protein RecR [Alphaproteobacteria bacterium]|nr:recombination protein RecR [Alphaproteobacteria bacterium]
MPRQITGSEIERLIQLLAKLPGLGPRSARRAALHLIKNKDRLLDPLTTALGEAGAKVVECTNCGNIDTVDPCTICSDPRRDTSIICVVEEVGDVWALERAAAVKGSYHVLGGTLSALEGIGPEELNIGTLLMRAEAPEVNEIIIAVNATVEGQTTAHYLTDQLKPSGVSVSRLAHGVPVGGELDYLDEGTLAAAMQARRPF